MRGGQYRQVGEQKQRLNRETKQWEDCDEHGHVQTEPPAETDAAAETPAVESSDDSEEEEV